MRSNAGMVNRQGDVDLRLAQVSAPVRNLAWLVQVIRSLIQAFVRSIQRSPHQEIHIKKEETTPDCPATMLRGPGTTPLSRSRFPAAHSAAPAPAATTHHVSATAASNAGEGPVTSSDPDY